MRKYKITQKANIFYIYKRFFFIFWEYYDTYSNLENANQTIKFLESEEIEIKL
jgi:hypothetical protein